MADTSNIKFFKNVYLAISEGVSSVGKSSWQHTEKERLVKEQLHRFIKCNHEKIYSK